MREFSKFQITTVIFLLMFVFAVGAIYTNTKDAVDKKNMNNNNYIEQPNQDQYKYQPPTNNVEDAKIQELSDQIENLNSQIQNLQQMQQHQQSNVRCRIYGVASAEGFVQLNQDEAIMEARNNDKDLVMICGL